MKRISLFLITVLFALLSLVVHAGGAVNINTADAQTIASNLHGIGEAKAEAIVAYREANGPFASADDLLKVQGVGEKTIESNRDRIRVE